MKNTFHFSLIFLFYAMLWGPLPEAISESPSRHTFSSTQTAFPAQILLAKKETSSNQTKSSLTVKSVRYHDHKKYTRVVLDLTGRVAIKESKNRLTQKATISLANIKLSKRAQQQIKRKNFPKAIAIFPEKPQTVTIVLALTSIRTYKLNTFRQPDRVVVDLYYANAKKTPENSVMVVIDPGHGGKDPGTSGRKGTKEKTIALQVSKYLRDLIRQRLKAKVLLTRSKDVFLSLEDRVKFANEKKMEWCGKDMGPEVNANKSRICLFISIHVNYHQEKSVQGLEIYHFGKASDPLALEVAARENGIKLESDTPPWQFIITDSLNDHKIKESQTFAETTSDKLVTTLRKNYKIKNHRMKTAPFYVLRFTTMPSILVEVGFLSNLSEEKRLRNKTFQKKLAEGIYRGVQGYLKSPRLNSS